MAVAAFPFSAAWHMEQPRVATASPGYQPGLDLLRLTAFAMVWTAHALAACKGMLPAKWVALLGGAGSCGVPVFFVLSAYLITDLLQRERASTGRVHLRAFYMRRILRIWPLYFGLLALYAALGMRFHGFRIEPERLLLSCLLAGNWYIAFHPAITTPLRALWSLSVEEQWYLIAPWIARRFAARQCAAGCVGVIACSAWLLLWLSRAGDPAMLHVTTWVNSGVQFQYLAMGALVALWLRGRVPVLRGALRLALAACGGAAILMASHCHIREAAVLHSAAALIAGYLLAGLGAVCLLFAFLGVAPARCPRGLVRLGQLTYGLYILHETAFFLTDALFRWLSIPVGVAAFCGNKLLALFLTILLAWVSWHVWERPFLRWKTRWIPAMHGGAG